MEKESFFTKMEECMMEIGNKIKCQEWENSIINQVSSHMKVNGRMTNSWEKESSITKFLISSNPILITIILMELMSFGRSMKVIYFIILR